MLPMLSPQVAEALADQLARDAEAKAGDEDPAVALELWVPSSR